MLPQRPKRPSMVWTVPSSSASSCSRSPTSPSRLPGPVPASAHDNRAAPAASMAPAAEQATSASALLSVQPWHSDAHLNARRYMITRLRQLHPVLQQDTTVPAWPRRAGMATTSSTTTTMELVLRLELMLYKAANSLAEYLNECTLQRRIQSLVTRVVHERVPNAMTRKRCFARSNSGDAEVGQWKRRKTAKACRVSFFLQDNLDVLHRVFSFLDGHQVWRCRAINSFAWTHLPRMVRSLRFDVASARLQNLDGHLHSVLQQCVHLEELTIVHTQYAQEAEATQGLSRAFLARSNGQDSQASSGLAVTGLSIVNEVAQVLRDPMLCRNLQALAFLAPFGHAMDANCVLTCLGAYCSASTSHRVLRSLRLEGTVLGDMRVVQLAQLMAANPSSFQSLAELSLRNNFIGDAGMSALLAHALPVCSAAIARVDFSRNILTDSHAQYLAALCPSLPRLQAMQLDENFIGWDGFAALGAACDSNDEQAVPVQRRIQVSHHRNCLPERHATQLFMSRSKGSASLCS